ncbi:hypothetical protein [Spongiactinospora sp. TRM90649]|uniref:hypothetical protein n=1 Tax=Spongiactinospora sp. TRM90649 TaxID=3031114 RepID=UPI0023F6C981|nr:hypothetical protein [Spongiactinospora sp. TRM90649]MDF5756657.1 hypothetical protein [Spongiactinospora sp. TRM90649]
MTVLPAWLLRHRVIIEPYLGDGAYGPVFGPAAVHPCLADDERKMVRDAEGSEVVSELTLYLMPGVVCPAGSRVTVNGRSTTVIGSYVRDGGGLPTPDHVEAVCQ